MDGLQIVQQTSVTEIMASGIGCPRMCDDLFLLLTLEWLDAADLVAFDTASLSNRCMKSTWLRVIRSIVDMRPMRGLLYKMVDRQRSANIVNAGSPMLNRSYH